MYADAPRASGIRTGGSMRYGLVQGIVKENYDKDQPGRIKVEYYIGEQGKMLTGWIPVMTPYVAKDAGQIVGVITIREHNHISLLFVDERYQYSGIGRALIGCVTDYLCDRKVLPLDNEEERILDALYEKEAGNFCTVNAAPYAREFYLKLGFEQTGDAFEREGIISVPMKLTVAE